MESFLQYHGSVFWVGNIQDGGGDPWHNLLFSKGLTDDQRNTSPLSSVFSSSTTWAAAADSSKLYNFWKQGGRPRKRGEGGAVRRWTGGRTDGCMTQQPAGHFFIPDSASVRPHTSRQKWARRQRRILRKQEQQGFRLSSIWCAVGCDGR